MAERPHGKVDHPMPAPGHPERNRSSVVPFRTSARIDHLAGTKPLTQLRPSPPARDVAHGDGDRLLLANQPLRRRPLEQRSDERTRLA